MALWIACGVHLFPEARSRDFLSFYTGASLALDGNWHGMYTEAGQLAREQTFVPERRNLVPFIRPPAYAILMAPLALLPFPLAFWVWMGVQTSVLLGCWAWAWRRFGLEAAAWAAVLIFGPLGVANGQDCALYLAVLIGAFALGDRDKFFLSGLVLGLGMVKFHLFLLWPFVLLVQKRWRMFSGLMVCCLAQALLSVSLIGWSGLRPYLDFIRHFYTSPEKGIDIGAILLNLGLSYQPVLVALTILVAGLVLWAARRTGPLWMMFALAIAGSLSIGPHVHYYDGTMILLPAWCVIFLSGLPVSRLAAATICTPLTTIAIILGPPLACFTALLLLAFVIALCLESILKSSPTPVVAPDGGVEAGPASDNWASRPAAQCIRV
jgi:hypothetical protein